MSLPHVSGNEASELARDLVGLNQVAVRYAYGPEQHLAEAEYFRTFDSAEGRLEFLLDDPSVREIWLGAVKKYQSERNLLIAGLAGKRTIVHAASRGPDETVSHIIFE